MRDSQRSIQRRIFTLAVTTTLIGTVGYAAPAQAAAQAGDPAVVQTATGRVRGLVAEDRRTFSGIPYAAAPVGDRRWQPPQPMPSWRGVRDATLPGSRCPQPNATGTSEDCLFLNVTTPPVSAGTRLPVMVWIHGGSLTTGAGSDYDASRLLAGGRVLLVTINYRLGALGFLAHPALDRGRSKSGAYGFADQTAALRWVRRNIAAFGGNPGNVTVFGESAGGGSVCAQLASPAAAGLFQRAIVESAPCVTNPAAQPWWRHLTQSESLGVQAAARFGCADPATAACLREVPIDELLAAAVPASQIAFPPAFGGDVMPEDPGVAVSSGRFNRVPVMHLGTRDEHRLFIAFEELAAGRPITEAEYQAAVRAQFGDDATRLLARYPSAAYGSPGLALSALFTDGAWSCPALWTERALARFVPTFAAEFADRNAPPLFPGTESVSFPLGAYHAAELQYLFGGPVFPDRLNAAQTRLSRQMVRYWLRFAATGNPNSVGSPVWPRFTPRAVHVQSLAPGPYGIRPVDLATRHQCAGWESQMG